METTTAGMIYCQARCLQVFHDKDFINNHHDWELSCWEKLFLSKIFFWEKICVFLHIKIFSWEKIFVFYIKQIFCWEKIFVYLQKIFVHSGQARRCAHLNTWTINYLQCVQSYMVKPGRPVNNFVATPGRDISDRQHRAWQFVTLRPMSAAAMGLAVSCSTRSWYFWNVGGIIESSAKQ